MPAPTWQKSSYCGQGESCIYVTRPTPTTLRLTESSDPSGAILETTPAAFADLLRVVRGGQPDTPGRELTVTFTPDGRVLLTAPGDPTVVTTTRTQWETFVLGVRSGEFDHFAAAPATV
ncbi:DUF397 domain-containing protein [Streptomyces triticagri]|uniref:DUF397 domain-containing protein n=1 Tax=Streptomyces triticagri TaxID=2293568 RepID=A0A372LWK4_9ACTN|nr:DUF397 domain-containing protein [Streptomyces triticagri]RFU83031.1 DUF397 domain-containing protein [Streptomyces triticagri]